MDYSRTTVSSIMTAYTKLEKKSSAMQSSEWQSKCTEWDRLQLKLFTQKSKTTVPQITSEMITYIQNPISILEATCGTVVLRFRITILFNVRLSQSTFGHCFSSKTKQFCFSKTLYSGPWKTHKVRCSRHGLFSKINFNNPVSLHV